VSYAKVFVDKGAMHIRVTFTAGIWLYCDYFI
jgi:hypothetical protein